MLNEETLKQSIGGLSLSWTIIGGILLFIVGVIDGLVRPLKCN